jgi:hypothetical protein
MNTSFAAGVISTVNLANMQRTLDGIGGFARESLARESVANMERTLDGIGGFARESLARESVANMERTLDGIGGFARESLADVESALAGISGLSWEFLADVESALAGIGLPAPAAEPVTPTESLMEQQFAEVPAETLLLLLVGLALVRADLAEVVLHELLVFGRLALGGYAWLSDELPDATGLAWIHLVVAAVRARKSGPRSD